MKMVSTMFQEKIDITDNEIFCLVIENPKLLYRFLSDIYNQTMGMDGDIVLSNDDKILKISKTVEFINSIFSVDINEKKIVSKLNSLLEKEALNENNYIKTMNLICTIEKYVYQLSDSFPYCIDCSGLDAAQLVKMCGISIIDDCSCLAEKIYNYMNIVRDLLGEKLFIFVNIRSFLDDDEMERFIETVISHKFFVLLVENKDCSKLAGLKKMIIDKDLCVI